MKRLYGCIMVVLATMLLFANADADEINAAEVEEYEVLNRESHEIVCDAEFDDWELHQSILVMGEDTWEPWAGGTRSNDKDLTARLRVLYDVENLYFALEVDDDDYVAEGGNPWENDGVQMAIDGTNEDFPPPGGLNGTTTQLYNFAIINGWQAEAGQFMGDVEVDSPEGIVMVRDKAAKQTLFEWRLPVELFADDDLELEAGKKIAFAIIINDSDDDAKGQCGWVGWGNHTIVHGKNTEEMKALVLSSEGLAVDAIDKLATTWGKIKN